MPERTVCPHCGGHPVVSVEQEGAWVTGAYAHCDCTSTTVHQDRKTLKLPQETFEQAKARWFRAVELKQTSGKMKDLFDDFDLEPTDP